MEIKSFVFLSSGQVSTFKIHELVCDVQRESEGDRGTTSYSTLSRTHHPLDQAVSTGQGEVARAGGLACLGDTTLLPFALPHQAQFKKPCRTASGQFPDALQDSHLHRSCSLSSCICSIHH